MPALQPRQAQDQ